MKNKTLKFSSSNLINLMDKNKIKTVSQLQKLIAVEMGVDAPERQTIHNWVNNVSTPDGRYLPTLAKVLKVKMEDLFDGKS